MMNEALPSGKRMHQHAEAQAFLYTGEGSVAYGATGAFIAVATEASAKHGTSAELLRSGFHSAQAQKRGTQPKLKDAKTMQVNWLRGAQSNWRTGVTVYDTLVYEQVWQGIDLEYRATDGGLVPRIVAAKAANLSQVVLDTGTQALTINGKGHLEARLGDVTLTFGKLRAYQMVAGKRVNIDAQYRVLENGRFGYELNGSYKRGEGVTIHPDIVWSKYVKSYVPNQGTFTDMAIDSLGNSYFVGNANGVDAPLNSGAFQTTYAGGESDVIVMKLNAAGTTILYTTLLGGSGTDEGYGIAVDAAGQAAIYGRTASDDFPVTAGSHDDSLQGNRDLFVTKLDANGSTLIFSSYLGGTTREEPTAVCVDSNGHVIVTGLTLSSDFPTTGGAYQTTYDASSSKCFVSKFDGSTGQLLASTFLGGTTESQGNDLAVDAMDAIVVGGFTEDNDFPITGLAHGTGISDRRAFAAKLSNDLTNLIWSTVLGGPNYDEASAIALDSDGNVYLAGYTQSSSFPTTSGAYRETFESSYERFITKLSPDGQSLVYSSFFGNGNVIVDDMVVDSLGRAILANTFRAPATSSGGGYQAPFADGETVVVSAFNAAGSDLEFTAVLGGRSEDAGMAIGLDQSGNIQVMGKTRSSEFPTTEDALYDVVAGREDSFLSKLNPTGSTLVYSSILQRSEISERFRLLIDPSDKPVIVIDLASSDNFATPGSVDDTFNGKWDIGIMKLDADATQVEWATFVGGRDTERTLDVDIDDSGNIYVLAETYSTDFPTTTRASGTDPPLPVGYTLAKISATGDQLLFSSYLVGDYEYTRYRGLAVGHNNQVYLAGITAEKDFPVTDGAYDTIFGDGNPYNNFFDLFLYSLDTQNGNVLYSTFLGGARSEELIDMDVDQQGRVIVAGATSSMDYPTTIDAYKVAKFINSYAEVGFISKMSSDGSDLVFSTFLGQEIYDIELDSEDNIYAMTRAKRGELGVPISSFLSDYHNVVHLSAEGDRILNNYTYDKKYFSINIELKSDNAVARLVYSNDDSLPVTDGTSATESNTHLSFLNPDLQEFSFGSFFDTSDGGRIVDFKIDSDDNLVLLGMFNYNNSTVKPEIFEIGTQQSIFLTNVLPENCQGPTARILLLEECCLPNPTVIHWCQDYPYQFRTEVAGTGPLRYQWYKDGQPVPGANQAQFTIDGSIADEGAYYCEVSSACSVTTTQTINFETSFGFPLIEEPQDMTVCTDAYVRLDTKIIGGTADFYYKVDGQPYFSWTDDREAYADFLMTPIMDGNHYVEIDMNCGLMATTGAQITWAPGTMTMNLDPGTQGPGLGLPRFDLGIGCPDMQHGISVDVTPDIPFELENGVVTLSEQPTHDVVIDVTVDYGQYNPVIEATGYYLHTQSTGLLDVNGDGCNTEADLIALAALWRETYENDGDGDQLITVRDFLYLPANNPGACP